MNITDIINITPSKLNNTHITHITHMLDFNIKHISLIFYSTRGICYNYIRRDKYYDLSNHNKYRNHYYRINIMQHITHVIFIENFNKKIKLPINVTHLTVTTIYYKKIILPHNITHLNFNNYCNQKIPQNVTHLSCSVRYKIKIPRNIIYLTIFNLHQSKINMKIPSNITHLRIIGFGFRLIFSQNVITNKYILNNHISEIQMTMIIKNNKNNLKLYIKNSYIEDYIFY